MMDQLIKTFEWLTRTCLFCDTDSNVSVDPLEKFQSNRNQEFSLHPEAAYAKHARSGCRVDAIGLELL